MSIQVTHDTEAITYFVVGYSHSTKEFFVSSDKTHEHFGECNTEIVDDEFTGLELASEWADLGEDEVNNLAIDLEEMIGAQL
jgi:hypothetical protein